MKTSFLQGKTIRRISLLIIDILVILVSEFLSLLIRFEFRFDSISPEYLHTLGVYTPVNIGVTIILFIIFQLYSSLWAYASVQEMPLRDRSLRGLHRFADGRHLGYGEWKSPVPTMCCIF